MKLPPGYFLKWTGQYELLERVRARLAYILPLTIAIVFVILYMNFKGVAADADRHVCACRSRRVGAIWTLWLRAASTRRSPSGSA